MAKRGRPKKTTQKEVRASNTNQNYLQKVSQEMEANQSRLSMVLGALILVVVGVLIFNYFNKNKSSLGPAQQTDQNQQTQDVSPENLPGKYTVKEGDTLFIIAEKYYQDGSKFEEIAKANSITDVDTLEPGQILQIPKLELPSPTPSENPQPSPTESPSPTETPQPTPVSETSQPKKGEELGTGGGNTTIWGPNITENTYTVQEGDWLSTIAARAYGDIMSYQKIAQVNNLENPDYIVPGQVLKIPR